MLALIVCAFVATPSNGLATLRADIRKAWNANKTSYHRFLAAGYLLAREALDNVEWKVADKALRKQGITYVPEIDAQRWTASDSLFSVKVGALIHEVRLRWEIWRPV